MSDGIIISWWGADLRLAGGDGRQRRRTLAEGEDPARAIAELAAGAGRATRDVRIIYQSDSLEAHEINGAEGSRRALQRRLRRDFPALDAPAAVWAVEPAPRGRDGAGGSAWLHFDRSGRLPAAAAALAQRGLKVRGAWTLIALLEAASGRAGRGSVNLIAAADRSLLTSVSPEGGRWVKAHDGPDFLDPTLASLRSALARFDEGDPPGGIVVIEDGPQADMLREAARGLGPAGSSLTDLLANADRLVPGDPGDLLPPPPWRNRRAARGGLAAGGVALLSAVLCLCAAQHRRERARLEMAAEETRLRRREAEAAAALARQRTSAQWAEALSRADGPAQHQEELLLALARELPKTAVLHRVVIDRADFFLAGVNIRTDAAGAESWNGFRAALGSAGNPWRIDDAPEAPAADFSLRGRFCSAPSAPASEPGDGRRPPDDGSSAGDAVRRRLEVGGHLGAPDSESGSERLAAICARLPAAAAFFPRWQEWSRFWAIQARPAEEFPGFEIRHYTLDALRPTLDAWPQIVATVAALCRQPGLTIERLVLVAGADDNFSQAEIAVDVRLRP